MTQIRKVMPVFVAAVLSTFVVNTSRADTVIQFPLAGILDKRCVTTLTNGMIVPWNLHTDGLETLQNAFATVAVAKMKGAPVINALPDDGRFAADDRHPEVVLNFSNDAPATSPQTHQVAPVTDISFSVPSATYSKFFLFFNGSHGGTTVTITLKYSDAMETKTVKIPDYAAAIPANDPVIFNLAPNLSKWSLTTTVTEVGGHHITGVVLVPMAGKTLTGISFQRSAEGFLVFWGATAVATSAVDTSNDAGAVDAALPDGGPADLAGGPSDRQDSTDAGGGGGASGQNGGTGGAAAPGTGGSGSGSAGNGGAPSSNPHSSGGCRLIAATVQRPFDDHELWLTLATFAVFFLRRSRGRGPQSGLARGSQIGWSRHSREAHHGSR